MTQLLLPAMTMVMVEVAVQLKLPLVVVAAVESKFHVCNHTAAAGSKKVASCDTFSG